MLEWSVHPRCHASLKHARSRHWAYLCGLQPLRYKSFHCSKANPIFIEQWFPISLLQFLFCLWDLPVLGTFGGAFCDALAGLELLGSSDPPASASCVVRY